MQSIDEFRQRFAESLGRKRAKPQSGESVFRLATSRAEEVEGQNRTLRFCFSESSIDRVGDTINQDGWELANFLKNPVALFGHDSLSPPIGRAKNLTITGARLLGDIEFADADTYAFADTIYRLCKGGFINAVSVGFNPIEWSFVNTQDRPFGIDFKRQELLEISVVPIPAQPQALIEARSAGIDTGPLVEWAERVLEAGDFAVLKRADLETLRKQAIPPLRSVTRASDWKVGAARDLPIDDADGWDGAAAEASIFAHAGGDDFNPATARKGFLLYDAAAPKLRGSYKEPFAHVVNGALKAVKGGIHAAASRLPQVQGVSDSVKAEARAVIDHYEGKMKDGKAIGKDESVGGDGHDDGSGIVSAMGNCGRTRDEDCGMKDPQQCSVHCDEAMALDDYDGKVLNVLRKLGIIKGVRRLSVANHKDLMEAAAHHEKAAAFHQNASDLHVKAAAHHDAARDCIKAVLARHDAAYDPDNDGDGDGKPDGADGADGGNNGDGADGHVRRQRTAEIAKREAEVAKFFKERGIDVVD